MPCDFSEETSTAMAAVTATTKKLHLHILDAQIARFAVGGARKQSIIIVSIKAKICVRLTCANETKKTKTKTENYQLETTIDEVSQAKEFNI